MLKPTRSSLWVACTAACWFMSSSATADESVAAEVAGAVIENPDCVGAAVANQALEEGVKRGRRLLSRIGINPRADAAPVPCGDRGATTAGTAPGADAGAAATSPSAGVSQSTSTPAPVAASAEPTQRRGLFSGLRQQGNAQSRRDCGALGAGCADGMQPLVACMNEVSFWGEMATAVERKRDASSDLTPVQVAEINADIAALRAAHAAGARNVEPADPSRPNRHFDWLTPDEYSVAATAASQKLNAHRQECNRRHARF